MFVLLLGSSAQTHPRPISTGPPKAGLEPSLLASVAPRVHLLHSSLWARFGHTTLGSNHLSPTLEVLAYTWSPPPLSLGPNTILLGSFWALWPCQQKKICTT